MKKDVFDELIVVKRSGQRVSFNTYKVAVAIKSAFDSVGKYDEKDINNIYEYVLKYIEDNYISRKTINVEDIQDIIESELKSKKYFDVYNEFSQYRKKRAESRRAFKMRQQHKFAIAMEKIISDNLLKGEDNYKSNEILVKYGNIVLSEFVKSYIVDNKYLRMHDEGNIYINNIQDASLGRVSHTNLIIEKVIEECNDHTYLLKYLLDISQEINGEIHISSIDKILNKCILKKFKEIFIEYLNDNLKITNYDNYVNIDSIIEIVTQSESISILENILPHALNKRVKDIFEFTYEKSLNKVKKLLYKDLLCFLKNLDMTGKKYSFSIGEGNSLIIDILLDIINNNEKFNNVFIIYKIKSIEDIHLKKIFESIKSNKNVLIENIKGGEYFSNGIKIYDNYNDEYYSDGRMIISSTSINMARLGIIYKGLKKSDFYKNLEELLDLVKNELLLMFEIIGNKTKDNYKLLFNGNILYDEKMDSGGKIRKVIKNSNLLIGIVGLKECIMLLENDNKKQYKLLCEILEFINKKCNSYREETKINFYSYEPYEEKSRKYFMGLDKSIYGIRKNITDKKMYDLLCNINFLKKDYKKLGNISKLLKCGNITIQNNNITYNKFIETIKNMIINNIGIIRFKEDTG